MHHVESEFVLTVETTQRSDTGVGKGKAGRDKSEGHVGEDIQRRASEIGCETQGRVEAEG